MRTAIVAAAALAVTAAACPAMAQVPPEIAAKVKASAGQIDLTVGALYAPLLPKEPWAGIDVTRDVAYGPDPMQKLDVFDPQKGPAQRDDNHLVSKGKRPVLIVVHGGGFVRGDKRNTDNMAVWAAGKGMVGISVNYRLAPAATWPAATNDLKAAIAWTRANIARFGGDPDRIYLWGHSAGANHVADYVAHTELHGPEAAGVRAAILMSAYYSPTLQGPPHAYYGTDASVQTTSAAVERLTKVKTPLFVINAEYDPEFFRAYAAALDEGLTKAGIAHARLVAKDHGHLDEGLAVGTSDVWVSDPVLKFIQSH
jgi:acetyl esterase/lipase